MSREINVLYQSDDNYAPYMGVSILSLLSNNTDIDTITIYVISVGISKENEEKLYKTVNKFGRKLIVIDALKFQKENSNISKFKYLGFRENKHSHLKMLVSDMMPDMHGKLLYIDCDTVVEGSIGEIINFDMQGCSIGLVQDSLVCDEKLCIGFDNTDRYYNSGVILFDIDKWRTNNGSERFMSHIQKFTYGTVDQDAINVEFKSEIVTLPLKYNLQSVHLVITPKLYSKVCKHKEPFYSYEEIVAASGKPVIVHFLRFLGEHPWDRGALHPGKSLYDKYCSESEWRDEERGTHKTGAMFSAERLMYRCLPRGLFFRVFYCIHSQMIKRSSK